MPRAEKISDPPKSVRLRNAVQALKEAKAQGIKPNIAAVAQAYDVPSSTLGDHYNGRRKERHLAHQSQQALSEAQELVIVIWLQFWATLGLGKKRCQVMNMAYEQTGIVPGASWFSRFMARHSEVLLFDRGQPLDGKRASGFNRPVVEKHLREWEECITQWGIPVENIYNMDEKGIQLCGTRKGTNQKHVLSREEKKETRHYVVKSDNLELVTIIEAVCANGTALPPGFVTQPGNAGEWWNIPGVGG